MAASAPSRLDRRLGLSDAVVIGLAAMMGAGVFAAIGPAARAAGSGLLVGLAIAAFVASCNAASSAQLAAASPESGGTYVFGRQRLGEFWGFLAGWGFVVGKSASCAAMALTFGSYVSDRWGRWFAIGAVVLLTAANYHGVQKTMALTRVIVGVVLVALGTVVFACLAGGEVSVDRVGSLTATGGWRGILQSGGLLFFAFAGYARLATMGEEVRDPGRTIPRAVPIALGVTLVVYVMVFGSALLAIGPAALGASRSPLASAVGAGSFDGLAPVVRVGAAVASLGVLLSLIVGVSRTAFAMAANRELPSRLSAVHPIHRVPHVAEVTIGVIVVVLVAAADLRGVIGFSSFCVLVYYAITNAAAWTLSPAERRWPRVISVIGLAGCVTLSLTLPGASIAAGAAVLAVGAVGWLGLGRLRRSGTS